MIKLVCCKCGENVTARFFELFGIEVYEDGISTCAAPVNLHKLSLLIITEREHAKNPVIKLEKDEDAELSGWYERPLPSDVTAKERVYLSRVGLTFITLMMFQFSYLCPRCRPAELRELLQ